MTKTTRELADLLPADLLPVAERFWAKIKRGKRGECWEWQGARNSGGYGSITIQRRTIAAHRVAWVLHGGPIPHGLGICHTCDTPSCVNPEHLFVGTHSENMQDMIQKGRGNKATGDRNGSRLYPERRPRGDTHWSRINKHLMPRGERNGARLHPETRARGERNGSSKLTSAQVAQIRELLKNRSESYPAIARKFGVSKTTIRSIAIGKLWLQA